MTRIEHGLTRELRRRSPWTLSLLCAVGGLVCAASAQASDCFDHYNAEAWGGDGLAIVLCRNHSNDSRDSYMTSCELRHHGGARIQDLRRHGSLDRERLVYTDYNTTGDELGASDIDIVCRDRAGNSYTYHIGNPAADENGCCRNRDCGSVSCCNVDCSSNTEPPPPVTPVPSLDAGAPGNLAECDPMRSREYSNAARLLDVPAGSSTRLRFNIDNVAAPGQLAFAALSMSLYDSDHPGEEGKIYINGSSAIQLPAHASWDDQDSRAAISVPLGQLRSGSNVVEFGAGTRDRTYYKVSRVSLSVFGAACEAAPIVDAGRADSNRPDAYRPDSLQPQPDAGGEQPDRWAEPDDASDPDPVDAGGRLLDVAQGGDTDKTPQHNVGYIGGCRQLDMTSGGLLLLLGLLSLVYLVVRTPVGSQRSPGQRRPGSRARADVATRTTQTLR